MTMTDADLAAIREEVGSSPTDDQVADLWDQIGTRAGVALRIIRLRYADALRAAARGSISVPGAISIGAPSNPQALFDQIVRLESDLAVETGAVEDLMGAGITRMVRPELDRRPFWPPWRGR